VNSDFDNLLTVLETKGDQLDNLDTSYKRKVLEFMSSNFQWDDATRAGELNLVQDNGEIVNCALILMSEWRTRLPEYLNAKIEGNS
jgi:type III restriction enzyme